MAEYIWKDFTKNDLKNWILNNTSITSWSHVSNQILSEDELQNLEKTLGCTISPRTIWLWFEKPDNPTGWCLCAQTPGEQVINITFTFPQIYSIIKVKEGLNDETVRTVESNTIQARDIHEINIGMNAIETYTWNNVKFLNNFLNITNKDINKDIKTTGEHQYSSVYLTTLGSYGIQSKVFNILTAPDSAEIDSEGFLFTDKQDYKGTGVLKENSNKYKYWAVDDSNNPIVIAEDFTGGDTISTTITNVTDNSFVYNNKTYYKRADQDIYIFRRERVTKNSESPITCHVSQNWNDQDIIYGYSTIYNWRLYGGIYDRSSGGSQIVIKDYTWPTLTYTLNNTIQYRKYNENNWTTLNSGAFGNLLTSKTDTVSWRLKADDSYNEYTFLGGSYVDVYLPICKADFDIPLKCDITYNTLAPLNEEITMDANYFNQAFCRAYTSETLDKNIIVRYDHQQLISNNGLVFVECTAVDEYQYLERITQKYTFAALTSSGRVKDEQVWQVFIDTYLKWRMGRDSSYAYAILLIPRQ